MELANKIKGDEEECNKARKKYISIMWRFIQDLLEMEQKDLNTGEVTKIMDPMWERLQKFLNVDDEEIILQVIHLFSFIIFGTSLENVSAKTFNTYEENDFLYCFSRPCDDKPWEPQQRKMLWDLQSFHIPSSLNLYPLLVRRDLPIEWSYYFHTQ